MNSEKPEADLAEQVRSADESVEDEDLTTTPPELPLDADPADLADQHRDVPEDEPYDRG